jgi:VWFA-related protein
MRVFVAHQFRLAAVLFLVAGAVLGGQNLPAPPPQPPTFRIDVEYVEVDAVVTDAEGRFVRGLTQEDFQIFEDDRPQAISTFSLVDIPVERSTRPLYAAAPIDPDVASNERPFDGRIYVMVIDDLHTGFGRTPAVRLAARRFIQQYLGANDLMAVVHTAGPDDASQEFTNNRGLLLAAVDRTFGHKVPSAAAARAADAAARAGTSGREGGGPVADPVEAERFSNARRSLEALRSVADWFSTVRGRRKTVLFFSEGIDYDINSFDSRASTIMDVTRETLAAAARGNVSIYGVDARGLTLQGDDAIESAALSAAPDSTLAQGDRPLQSGLQLSQASLRQLSEDTGGFAVVNTNNLPDAFDRIVRDSSAYYAMAYYPPAGKVGTFRRIEVRTRRPGLQVRARRGYIASGPASQRAAGRPTDIASDRANLMTPEIRDVLASPLPVSGLAMRAFAAPFKGTAPNASVVLGLELRGRDLRLAPEDKLAVSYVAVDARGDVRTGSTDSVSLNLQPQTRTRVAASALRLLNRVDLPAGRYQIRLAAHDGGGGNVGSVSYDLDVPDFAKLPFSMSGLLLTSAASLVAPTVRPDEALRGVLPGPPVAGRTFPQNDELALFAEIYDNEGSRPHKVDITTTVTADDGRVLLTTGDTRDSSELEGRRGGYGYSARFSLKELAPGPYVLTVEARSRLADTPLARRQVEIVVTAAAPPPR